MVIVNIGPWTAALSLSIICIDRWIIAGVATIGVAVVIDTADDSIDIVD